MQALDLNNITLTGELAFRLGRNYSRLEDPMYRAAEIFQADKQGWPATGRAGRFWPCACTSESPDEKQRFWTKFWKRWIRSGTNADI